MQFGSASALFSLLSSSFLFFLLLFGPLDFRELIPSAFPHLFIAKQAIGDEGSSAR